MNLKGGSYFKYFFPVLIFIISLFSFTIIFVQGYYTDLDVHIKILEMHLETGKFPVPPLYYFTLYILKKVSSTNYMVSTVIILSLFVGWKFKIAEKYITEQSGGIKKYKMVVPLLIGGLMFFFPIYIPGIDGSKLYLGKFTPNIWHNSTTIFAFVFSILLFIKSLKYIDQPTNKNLGSLFLLGLLVLLSKPSFMFVFIPCFPMVYAMKNKEIDFHLLRVTALCIFFFLGIVILKWMIYSDGEIDRLLYEGEKTQVVVAPFEVWLLWTDQPIFDIISSFLFLILFLAFYFKRLIKDWHFQYAFFLGIVGLIVFWTFAESGERFAHGNFYWQIPICLFMVYMVLMKHWIQMVEVKSTIVNTIKALSKPHLILLLVYSLHVFSGFIYLFKLLYFGSFS